MLRPKPDQAHYDQVAAELASSPPIPGLWAKAMAEAGGIDAARALYIRMRAEQLRVSSPAASASKPSAKEIEQRSQLRRKMLFWSFWLVLAFYIAVVPVDYMASAASSDFSSNTVLEIRSMFPVKAAQRTDLDITRELLSMRPDLALSDPTLGTVQERIRIMENGVGFGPTVHQLGLRVNHVDRIGFCAVLAVICALACFVFPILWTRHKRPNPSQP